MQVKKWLVTVFAIFLCCLEMGSTADLGFAWERGKMYYFQNAFKLNWYKAADYCRAQGMFLVSMNDGQELDAVIAHVRNSGYFDRHNNLQMWTSGNDLGEPGHFYWSSTGARISFDRYAENEPNNLQYRDGSTEDCIVLEKSQGRNYTFDDRPCYREYYFLCETLYC